MRRRFRAHAVVELALLLPVAAALAASAVGLLRLAAARGRALSVARLGAALASRPDVPPAVARAELDDYAAEVQRWSGGSWRAGAGRVTDLPAANFYRIQRAEVTAVIGGRAIRERVALQEAVE